MRTEKEIREYLNKLTRLVKNCRNTKGISCPHCVKDRLRIRVLSWVLKEEGG